MYAMTINTNLNITQEKGSMKKIKNSGIATLRSVKIIFFAIKTFEINLQSNKHHISTSLYLSQGCKNFF